MRFTIVTKCSLAGLLVLIALSHLNILFSIFVKTFHTNSGNYCDAVAYFQLCHQNNMSRGKFHPGGLNTTGKGTCMVSTCHTLIVALCPKTVSTVKMFFKIV